MSSSKAKNIEDACFYAGIKVLGNTVYTKVGGTTYVTSFYYKADAESPKVRESLREQMLEIANRAGCYLFLEFQDYSFEEGWATFVQKKGLLEWVRMLDFDMEKLTQTFEYMQEEPSALDATAVLSEGIVSLNESIKKATDKKKFYSNASVLREHLKHIDTLRQDYRVGIDLTDSRIYNVLRDWNQYYFPVPSPEMKQEETVTITGLGDLTSALNAFI